MAWALAHNIGSYSHTNLLCAVLGTLLLVPLMHCTRSVFTGVSIRCHQVLMQPGDQLTWEVPTYTQQRSFYQAKDQAVT